VLKRQFIATEDTEITERNHGEIFITYCFIIIFVAVNVLKLFSESSVSSVAN